MAFDEKTNYAEFDFKKLGFRFPDETEHEISECYGTIEETLTSRSVTKKCGGVVKKSRVTGTGGGTLKITGHMPYERYTTMFGMNQEGLAEGVKAYGLDSVHPEVSITADVLNEDDVHKLKAWTRCKVTADLSRKIERGAEEVAELEIELEIFPDDNGRGMYEAIVDNIIDEQIETDWMAKFTPELVLVEG